MRMQTLLSTAVLVVLAHLMVLDAPAASVSYTYDAKGRLTKADYGIGKSITYTYDASGNIISEHSITPFLTVLKSGTGTGTVTSNIDGISCGSRCGKEFGINTIVVLTAAPGQNSAFSGWTGACTNSAGTCTVSMDSAKSVTATFNAAYTLSVTKTGIGSGTVTSTPSGIDCGATCSASFSPSTQVTLSAQPSGGFSFAGWSGACSGQTLCLVTMDGTKSVTATFNSGGGQTASCGSANGQTLSVAPSGFGVLCAAGMPSPVTTGNGLWNWTCTLQSNGASVNCSANIAASSYPLTLTLAGSGGGSVTSNPAGISCTTGSNSGCSANYNSGAGVTLTATPSTGSSFNSGWSGDCSGNSACVVNMNTARNVTANFSLIPNAQIGTTPYGTLTNACLAAISGNVIQAQNMLFTENLYLNRGISFTLLGGFNSSFGSRTGYTSLYGTVTLSGAGTKLIVDRLIIK